MTDQHISRAVTSEGRWLEEKMSAPPPGSPPEMLTWETAAAYWRARHDAVAAERDQLSRSLTIQRLAWALHHEEVGCWPDVDGCGAPRHHESTAERLLAALIKEAKR